MQELSLPRELKEGSTHTSTVEMKKARSSFLALTLAVISVKSAHAFFGVKQNDSLMRVSSKDGKGLTRQGNCDKGVT